MPADLTAKIYTDEDAARAHFESIRWPDGRTCFHCGTINNSTLLKGKATRPGLYKCKDCRKQFTAVMGTVYEKSHIPIHKWLLATHLLSASKKGMSSHQLYRMLGFGSYRTAWFMAHRIREAMNTNPDAPLGGDGKIVEVDETYVGGKMANKHADKRGVKAGSDGKEAVVTFVERGGSARSYHVRNVTVKTVRPLVVKTASPASHLMSDGSLLYKSVGQTFADHGAVNHVEGEYVLYARGIAHHSNTAENYFSLFKRGVLGTFHHISPTHLHRYLAEFDFRYSNRAALGVTDIERARKAVACTVGKRLTYRGMGAQENGIN